MGFVIYIDCPILVKKKKIPRSFLRLHPLSGSPLTSGQNLIPSPLLRTNTEESVDIQISLWLAEANPMWFLLSLQGAIATNDMIIRLYIIFLFWAIQEYSI